MLPDALRDVQHEFYASGNTLRRSSLAHEALHYLDTWKGRNRLMGIPTLNAPTRQQVSASPPKSTKSITEFSCHDDVTLGAFLCLIAWT